MPGKHNAGGCGCCGGEEGLDIGTCTCDGLNTITVQVTDNWGGSVNTGGSFSSAFTATASGCAFDARSTDYDSGTADLAWRVRAPVLLSGGLNRVRLDWYEAGVGSGVIDINYLTNPPPGPWRFNKPGTGGANYFDVELIC